MRSSFLKTLTSLMRKDNSVLVLTADMGYGVFEELEKEFPKRFLNTGITEQSTVSMAAGLALSGYKVFFYAQAPFATMRCFEQIRLDAAYNHTNIKIIGTSSGFSSNQLGTSHFSVEDIGLMRLLPNLTIFTPGDPYEAEWATKMAYKTNGPVYLRLSKNDSAVVHKQTISIPMGKGIKICNGNQLTIFVSGNLLPMAQGIVSSLNKLNIQACLISMPTIKPLDKEIIVNEAKRTKTIFTLEDHSIIGGLGSAVAEVLAELGEKVNFLRLGVPDKFTDIVGSEEYLLASNGLSEKKIVKSILNKLLEK